MADKKIVVKLSKVKVKLFRKYPWTIKPSFFLAGVLAPITIPVVIILLHTKEIKKFFTDTLITLIKDFYITIYQAIMSEIIDDINKD